MNSMRESCRSIEELDLGGNKLTDLIEIYKILQCTPNLKFLNLSENDLSRAAPVALAANCSSMASSQANHTNQFWPTSISSGSSTTAIHRTCFSPINQNHPTNPIGSRHHSTLGTPASGSLSSRGPSRVAEARRLAAAAAQGKKAPPSMASRLTNSARNSITGSRLTGRTGALPSSSSSSNGASTRASSTIHLARSLSSLSAKNVRNLSGIGRKGSDLRDTSIRSRKLQKSQEKLATNDFTGQAAMIKRASIGARDSASSKIFVEPINETDGDVDMGENSQAPNSCATAPNHGQTGACQPQVVATRGVQQTVTGYYCRPLPWSTINSSSQHNLPFKRFVFESIRALALNNTGCQWRVVCSILSRMPNLEELHLSLNNYQRIDLDPNQEFRHTSLKRLYLCNNPRLTDWQELTKLLVAFPSLEALSIADCNISQIPENLSEAREWQKLCGLNINGWPIKEWPIIERLNQLPSLTDLKCRNLEIFDSIDEPRDHLIARLPRLQRLNGSEIEERELAEKAFLKFFVTNSHLERPNRFYELMLIHGSVGAQVNVDVDLSPPSQANIHVVYLNRNYYRSTNQDDILMSEDFLTKLMDNIDTEVVQQQSIDHQADSLEESRLQEATPDEKDKLKSNLVRLFKDDSQEVVSIEVDLRQSVRKFKHSLANLFGLSSQNIILYYIDREMVGLMGPELIKHNQKKLWNYNVQDGDQFIVEER